MDPLTGKQKRSLRGMAQRLPPALQVGKGGPTPAIVAAIAELLDRRELVKIRLPACPPAARRSTAEDLAGTLGARCLGTRGHTVLLYRPNESLPPDRRIALPEP